MAGSTNNLFSCKVIMILLVLVFITQTAKSQWCIAGSLSEGAITPTITSQTTAGFNPNGNVPYWSFVGTAGTTYYFGLCSSANTNNSVLSIYDGATPSGNLVAANDDACGKKSSMTFVCPATQTYYIAANKYPNSNFSNAGNLVLTYYTCGVITPVVTSLTEDWSVSNVTTACTNWMAHGTGAEGDWAINNVAYGFAYGTNLAGGSGNELLFYGNQYEIYGTGVTKVATVTSFPINTMGESFITFSWLHSLQINGDNGVSGSNTVTLKLQSSNDLINWTDQWSASYPVTSAATAPLNNTTQSVVINTSVNGTTWIRFYLNAVPGKLAFWAIDNGTTPTIVLPIELTKYTAQQLNTKTKLEWTTASETNNNYFTVERSLDGKNFTAIATVKGGDNINTLLNYSAFDEEPAIGINYYRLKQTDYSGSYKYSNIIPLNFLSEGVVFSNIRPNPATDNISFDFYSPISTKGNIQIIDITGRLVSNESQNISAGNQTINTTLNSLSNGIYYLKVSIDQLGYSHTSKIIKN